LLFLEKVFSVKFSLQEEFEDLVNEWNTHRIRKHIYILPNLYDIHDNLCFIASDDIDLRTEISSLDEELP